MCKEIAPLTLWFLLLILFANAQTANAQGYWPVVYGDRITKRYYSPECGEAAKIDQDNRQGFRSAAAAEKAGFVRGETCSASTSAGGKDIKFFGDKSKRLFYPESCTGNVSIPISDLVTFAANEEPEKLGYKIALCLVTEPTGEQTPTQAARKAKVVPMKRAALPRVIAITSEPGEWLGKLVTVEADVNITDLWKYDGDTYSFRITDGSAGFYLYMEKKAARPLRALILKQPAADGVYGQFTFYLDPTAYLLNGDLYGRLVSYSVRAD